MCPSDERDLSPKEKKSNPWKATVLTLMPDFFPGSLGQSLSGRGLEQNIWDLKTVDIRNFASDKHKTVDDTPCGGGAGMVMKAPVLDEAIRSVESEPGPLLYLSPRGRRLDQDFVKDLTQAAGVKLLCGRFEGVDQRVLDKHAVCEVSLGDYILSGGELGAMVLLDACVRLLPGVMGNEASAQEESFESGLLEYPLYTRPVSWQGVEVPSVLLSGHHKKIEAWRHAQAENITQERRPDLWDRYQRKKDKG